MKSNGDIVLSTWNNGVKQGLSVAAVKDEIEVSIEKNNSAVFTLIFDKHGQVIKKSDPTNQFDTAAIKIFAGDSPPVVTIKGPKGNTTWAVGEAMNYSATATDPDDISTYATPSANVY